LTGSDSESHVISDGNEAKSLATAGVSIRHLHLSPTATGQIEALGRNQLPSIMNVLASPNLSQETREELLLSSFRLLGCVSGHDVDWLSYYSHPNFLPRGLYFNCSEFKDIDTNHPGFAVNRASFGNAGAMLERAGLTTFGLLLDQLRIGIPEFPSGFGTTKLTELWDALTGLAKERMKNPEALDEWALRHPIGGRPISESDGVTNDLAIEQSPLEDLLSARTRSLDLGVLHLGKKSDMIRNQGLMTIEDVATYPPSRLLSLPSMGMKTINRIGEALQALGKAQLPNGDIDWETYCEVMQLALLPSQRLEGSLSETIALLPLVIEETILSGETEDNRIILENRIMKPPSERLTLEALGELMPTRITRERVRQKEAMILKRLAAALIHGDYAKAPYHFRPEFTAPWLKAAEHFASVDTDMTLNELIIGLETAWGVSSEAFQDQLPLITAIITGELPTGMEFRQAMTVEANLLSQGSGAAQGTPLKNLQIKKAVGALAEEGIFDVGDFLDAAASGDVNVEKSGPARITREHVGFLAESVDESGNVDWQNYAWLAGVPIFPEREIDSPADFLEEIVPTAIGVLEARQLSAIASQTFQLRTALPLQGRPTTEALAERFGTHGSSVKRIETELLKLLHEVFLDRHLSIARAHVRRCFLDRWTEVDKAFNEVGGDVELVERILAGRWGTSPDALEPHMPAIVAIMTGYPLGRLGRHTKMQTQIGGATDQNRRRKQPERTQLEQILPQRVVLRGFHRTH